MAMLSGYCFTILLNKDTTVSILSIGVLLGVKFDSVGDVAKLGILLLILK